MLEDLEIGEAQAVEPERLARKTEELPPAIAKAWDETPVGEARRVRVRTKPDQYQGVVGLALLRLLKARASSQHFIAFKASFKVEDEFSDMDGGALVLYWQKKPGRGKKPEPAIEPMPSEPITTKQKKGGGATAGA